MCPVSPMLAEACKSVERAIDKYPKGMYSEIKYDGERVQLHKRGDEFKYEIYLKLFLFFVMHSLCILCNEKKIPIIRYNIFRFYVREQYFTFEMKQK